MPLSRTLLYALLLVIPAVTGLSACDQNNNGYKPSYTHDKTYNITVLFTNNDSSYPELSILKERSRIINDIRSTVESSGGYVLTFAGGETYSLADTPGITFDLPEYDAIVVSKDMFYLPLETIKQRQEESTSWLLSSNMYESETGFPVFNAFRFIGLDGLTVVVLGVTAIEDEEKAEQRKNLSGLDIASPQKVLETFVPGLSNQADITIVLTDSPEGYHKGNYPDPASLENIDLILGASSHKSIPPALSSEPLQGCDNIITRVDMKVRNGKILKKTQQQIHVHAQKALFRYLEQIEA